MTWELWVVVGWVALSGLVNVLWVGKERKPITAPEAFWIVLISAALIILILVGASS